MCPSKELDLAGEPFEKSKKQVIARDNQKPRTQQKNDRIAEDRLKTLIDGLTGSGFPKGDYLTFYNFNQAYKERNSTKTPYEKAYYKRAFTSKQLVDWYEELNKTDVYMRNFKLQKQIAKSLVDTVIITSNPNWNPTKRQEKINYTINKLWDESTFNKDYSGTNYYTYYSVVWALQQFSQQLKSKLKKHYKTKKPFDMYGFIIKLLKQGKYADINKLPTPTTINLPQIERPPHFDAFVTKVISSLASEENIMLEFAAQFAITMPAIQLYADRKITTPVFTDNVKKLRNVAKKVEQTFPTEELTQYGDLPQKCVNNALLTCKKIFAVKIPS